MYLSLIQCLSCCDSLLFCSQILCKGIIRQENANSEQEHGSFDRRPVLEYGVVIYYYTLPSPRVGEGKVPVSIVLYIDGTFIKKGIPIRPVTVSTLHIVTDIIRDNFYIIPDIIPDILNFLLHDSRLPQ